MLSIAGILGVGPVLLVEMQKGTLRDVCALATFLLLRRDTRTKANLKKHLIGGLA